MFKVEKNLYLHHRLIQVVPAFVGLGHALFYFQNSAYLELTWLCIINSFLLSYSLYFFNEKFLPVAVLWSAASLPAWILHSLITRNFFPTSFLLHVGCAIISLYALPYCKIKRQSVLLAYLYFIILQIATYIAGMFLPRFPGMPHLGAVNLVHSSIPGIQFTTFYLILYYILSSLIVIIYLWITYFLLKWIQQYRKMQKILSHVDLEVMEK